MKKNQSPQIVKESDTSGLLLVKGHTVVLDKFITGNSKDKVKLKEILSIKESPHMATGFVEIEETSFDWQTQNINIRGIS